MGTRPTSARMSPVVFGLGIWEIAAILGVALLVFGPKKLPELARSLGRGIREFRKATDSFKATVESEADSETHPVTDASPVQPQQLAPPPDDLAHPESQTTVPQDAVVTGSQDAVPREAETLETSPQAAHHEDPPPPDQVRGEPGPDESPHTKS